MKKIIISVSALLIIFFAIGWYFSGEVIAFTPDSYEKMKKEKKFNDPSTFGVKPEELMFPTFENSKNKSGKILKIKAWFFKGKSVQSPTFIVLHGKGDNRIGSLKYAGMLAKAGYNVLSYDQRHHGKSDGKFTSYGYYERYDVSAAIDFLEKSNRCNTKKLGIIGESFGAAVSIMATAIDPRIKLLIEDSAYKDMNSIIADYAKEMFGLPQFPIVDFALFISGLRASFDVTEVSPLNEIKKITVPTLIIHCVDDESG